MIVSHLPPPFRILCMGKEKEKTEIVNTRLGKNSSYDRESTLHARTQQRMAQRVRPECKFREYSAPKLFADLAFFRTLTLLNLFGAGAPLVVQRFMHIDAAINARKDSKRVAITVLVTAETELLPSA